jgi:hypothetical protein
MALAVTSGLSGTARPVSWSLTATNAQDQVTSERGGPSPYRAVEPWLLLLLYVEEESLHNSKHKKKCLCLCQTQFHCYICVRACAFVATVEGCIFTQYLVLAIEVSGSFFPAPERRGCFNFMTNGKTSVINSDVTADVKVKVMAYN